MPFRSFRIFGSPFGPPFFSGLEFLSDLEIVRLARFGIFQRLIRVREFGERRLDAPQLLGLFAMISVRMEKFCQAEVRILDLGVNGIIRNAEDIVKRIGILDTLKVFVKRYTQLGSSSGNVPGCSGIFSFGGRRRIG